VLVALACISPAAVAAPADAQTASGGAAFPTGPGLQMASPSDAMLGDVVTFSGVLPEAPSSDRRPAATAQRSLDPDRDHDR
jgi:hypothetical protein